VAQPRPGAERLGDLAGAWPPTAAPPRPATPRAGLQLAFLLREQGEREQALTVAQELAAAGDEEADAVAACWQWCATLDPALEGRLRVGAATSRPARADLAALLLQTRRAAEARSVLERGAKLGEQVAWLPLGNLYREELGDDEAARGGLPRRHPGRRLLLPPQPGPCCWPTAATSPAPPRSSSAAPTPVTGSPPPPSPSSRRV
jgi:hypothetical protein